jgi:biopolymer transport protein ExbB
MNGRTVIRRTWQPALRACVLLLVCLFVSQVRTEDEPTGDAGTPAVPVVVSSTPDPIQTPHSLSPNASPWTVFVKGGWSMWPILLCLLLGLMFFVERIINLRKRRHAPDGLDKDIVHVVDTRGVDSGLALCLEKQCSLARVLYAALLRYGTSRQEMEAAIHDECSRLQYDLRRNSRWILLMVITAPLLGILGGVVGLIGSLDAVASMQNIARTEILAGIAAVALIPAAWGLIVAIPLIVAHQLVRARADDIVRDVTERSVDSIITLDRKARRSIRLIEDIEEHLETQEMVAPKIPPSLDEEFSEGGDKTIKSSVTTPAHLPAVSYPDAVRKSSTHGDVKAVTDPNVQAQKSTSSTENKAR